MNNSLPQIRIGNGYDMHRLVSGRPLILGGVKIEHPEGLGLEGHSDADVLTHGIMDALLGALALGDIGHYFPDTDPQWQGADSGQLLSAIYGSILDAGWRLGNADLTVICQAPKLAPHIAGMRERIAELLQCDPGQVSVKATTTEKLGFTGRKEGIAVQAVVLLESQ